MNPTNEQSIIVDAVRNSHSNLLINALAGTGKTSTLELIQAASRDQPVLCLAFNKKIAEEMTKRFPSTTTVRTFNGVGHRIWAKSVSSITLDPKKTQALLKVELDKLRGEDRAEVSDSYWEIINGVGLAKSLGYIPEQKFPQAKKLCDKKTFHLALEEAPSELTASIIDSILINSITAAYKGLIDFNDQVYMPALFGGSFPRFPFVLVDEYQDISPTNLALLRKLVSNRIAAVGDSWQSIYAFRGVQLNVGEVLREEFEMKEFDLSVSFRCPQAIVELARWRAPNFQWVKTGGIVGEIRNPTYTSFPDGSAVICRNNAPLFRLGLNLLANKRSVNISGSDIGLKITHLMKKIGASGDSRADLLIKIEGWKNEKLSTSQSTASILDMAACMRIFAEYGTTLDSAVAYAEHLFKQQGTIKLMTGHKAKGLEFEQVYHLDSWLIGDDDQDKNLRYVIQTRAKQAYYEINSEDIR